ncbi:MAG: DUF1579 family protein [Gammaproteobacteria bacterium]
MKKTCLNIALILLTASACAGHHEKDEATATGEEAMMQAMQAAITPGEAHKMLADSVGDYDAQMQMWTGPGAQAMETTMTVKRHMDLDGRVLVERWKGSVMGAPFEGASRTGYDNIKKRYWSTWTDNMSTGLLVMYGDWDKMKEQMQLKGTSVHPMTGKEYSTRAVGTYPAPGKETVTMYEDHGQGEFKSMALTLTRR